jgi:serine/tyrosine/threonine adenylyltransferase
MTAQIEAVDFFAFDNSYARLPDRFFALLPPTPVVAPRLVRLNEKLAWHLRLDPGKLAAPEGVEILAGNRVPKRGEPLAMAYAGHQFGTFVPQLGDGRAILLGEVIDRDGVRRDIQLKGSGPTPFSRRGDGRAALGPVLREYIVSEAMAVLGIPTTRALAAVTTGEPVWREKPLPGAVLTRIASSHIRIGTFQFFAARGDLDAVRRLADHVIARHYPEAVDAANRYRTLLDLVISRQAALIAKWQLVGFIHGVMNTDNMSIAGETIDYGPCAFIDVYHPETVYSSIDKIGRYAYGNQPRIAQWNLARLAEAFLPLLAEDEDAAVKEAQKAIDAFAAGFETAYAAGLSRKLGLFRPRPDDLSLAQDLLERMAHNGADFTLLFPPAVRRRCQPPRRRGCAQLVYRSELLRRLGGEMAPSACGGGYRGERAPGGDACGQPCFHPTQSSGGGGDLRSRERWVFPALREFADGGLHALRGSTGLQPLRRSAAARSSRAPNVLRHLTKQGQARRRHLTTTAARRTVTSRITLRTTRGSCRSVFLAKCLLFMVSAQGLEPWTR